MNRASTPTLSAYDKGAGRAAGDDLPKHLSSEQRERIRAAIAKLPSLTQRVFFADRIEGRNYIEIASMTGLTIREVEREIARVIVAIDRALSQPPRRRRWWRWR